ncbi:LSM domain-containing protein [Heterostelium album PN500]|uniref:U6 snRNA-associated Sm-like protein LSm8 n=1 Tax=Heterostelium pallidum (strain ATCC 26659 / Pp 5 / PN500) TaxID=670386 RepID=D3BUN0_HETP5|nr:LSM domain-containing protein [Heterostelium album PN500]EFA74818.1 LSM domain-containing protein [Heterostelium album PN500]|eukprot:XP_020426952.1 LSM domain-containing protein [Heterostelium album PN500]
MIVNKKKLLTVVERVLVLTADGRNIVGTLRGLDQMINVILEHCHERIYTDEGVEIFNLGVHIIKGDDVNHCCTSKIYSSLMVQQLHYSLISFQINSIHSKALN